jgi:ferrochelatase
MVTLAKTGILVINLGTPDAPTPKAVRRYLAEFLWDPYIVQIPRPLWWLVLHGIILRLRPPKTAKLYQKIWSTRGSPLLSYSQDLVQSIQNQFQKMGEDYPIVLGMRYGNPAIQDALELLQKKDVERIVVLPLYPQYSMPTTGSTLAQLTRSLKNLSWQPQVAFINNYHNEPLYICAISDSVKKQWQQQEPGELLIFSFHGLPEKYNARGDPYYQQCLTTAQAIANQLQLKEQQWRVVFQSRFGRERWLKPYCNEVLTSLPKSGIKKIDIICPGFPIDCLETLEEIAITNKEVFFHAGGQVYNYLPALNASDLHGKFLATILKRKTT